MYFLKSLIDIAIILLLLRLLIGPNEAYFDPIFRLIYRVTDILLTPSRYITRKPIQRTVLTLTGIVVLRGVIYVSLSTIPFLSGIGISLLSLVQLLFQAYMVIWFISLLSQRGFGTPFIKMVERAFLPFYSVFSQFRIQRHRFHLFLFLCLWVLYSLLSFVIRSVILPQVALSPLSFIHALGDGLTLIVGLFPGFFSVVIIIGALLSWVSPDPSNPVVQAIYGISEPFLAPFRRFVPCLGGLDVSPIIALLCFQVLGRVGQELIAGLMGVI